MNPPDVSEIPNYSVQWTSVMFINQTRTYWFRATVGTGDLIIQIGIPSTDTNGMFYFDPLEAWSDITTVLSVSSNAYVNSNTHFGQSSIGVTLEYLQGASVQSYPLKIQYNQSGGPQTLSIEVSSRGVLGDYIDWLPINTVNKSIYADYFSVV